MVLDRYERHGSVENSIEYGRVLIEELAEMGERVTRNPREEMRNTHQEIITG